MKDFEARRKALAAEAEVYRQTMKLELENIRLYTRQVRRKYTAVSPRNPLFAMAAPLLALLLGRGKSAKKAKWIPIVLMGFQFATKFAPVIPGIIAAVKGRRAGRKAFREEQRTPAATI
jgi:hypothetical protein